MVAEHLVKVYQRRVSATRTNTVRALDGVSLSLEQGEALGIIGESGSGKSTLARLLIGMEKPDAGSVYFGSKDLSEMDRAERRAMRRTVQVVFQDPLSSLDPRMRVSNIVAEPLRAVTNMSRVEIADRVIESLREVGLPESAATRYPHAFSGGQRQRIAIARALAVHPSYVLLDEPISSLDVSIGAQILELVETIRERHGTGYMLISHNLAHVRNSVQRVVVMRRGVIVEEGQVDEVFLRPMHEYTKELIAANPPFWGSRTGSAIECDG